MKNRIDRAESRSHHIFQKNFFNQTAMKINLSSVITLVFFAFTSAKAQEIITVQNGDTIELDSVKQVYIYGLKGVNLTVSGTDSKELSYKVFIRANEDAMLRNFGGGRLHNNLNAQALELFFKSTDSEGNSSSKGRTWIKDLFSGNTIQNQIVKEARLEISLPKALALKINSRYSNLTISSIMGEVDVKNKSGSVKIEEAGSNVVIDNDYGDNDLTKINGNITLNSRSANTEIKSVVGNVDINSNYSELRLTDIKGTVNVTNKSGGLRAENIEGDIDFRGNYSKLIFKKIDGMVNVENTSGSVEAEFIHGLRIKGSYTNITASDILETRLVTIDSKSAKVNLKRIAGPITIDGTYLEIDLEKIGGDVRIYTKSGSLNALDLQGNFTIDGEYNKVDVRGFSGKNFEAETRSGSIRAELEGITEQVRIRNEHGSIDLKMNANAVKTGRLITNNGTISHSFDKSLIKREIKNETMHEIELAGTGSASVEIRCDSGSIDWK